MSTSWAWQMTIGVHWTSPRRVIADISCGTAEPAAKVKRNITHYKRDAGQILTRVPNSGVTRSGDAIEIRQRSLRAVVGKTYPMAGGTGRAAEGCLDSTNICFRPSHRPGIKPKPISRKEPGSGTTLGFSMSSTKLFAPEFHVQV